MHMDRRFWSNHSSNSFESKLLKNPKSVQEAKTGTWTSVKFKSKFKFKFIEKILVQIMCAVCLRMRSGEDFQGSPRLYQQILDLHVKRAMHRASFIAIAKSPAAQFVYRVPMLAGFQERRAQYL